MRPDNNAAPETYDVFISYKNEYREWVKVLAGNLKNQGYRVFLDVWELIPGESIAVKLCEALQKSRNGILIATPDAIDSGWIKDEYEEMLRAKREIDGFKIIPVLLGKEAPDFPFLRNVTWVDFRDKNKYHEAFYQLICALDDKAPGAEVALDMDIDLPMQVVDAPEQTPGQDEVSFVENIFEIFYTKQAVILLAQADRGQGAVKSYLLDRAIQQFGKNRVLHIVPPYSPDTDVSDYFSIVGRQCGFSDSIRTPAGFMAGFEERLGKGERLFLIVSGFENSSDSGREELAGVFRSLNERYQDNFRFLICGGEKLSDLYFTGTLSFLNQAEAIEWPELTVKDVLNMQERVKPGEQMDKDTAGKILGISGGHPRLATKCLDFWGLESESVFDEEACFEALFGSRFVWHLFTPYMQKEEEKDRICRMLVRDVVGPVQPFIVDPLIRRLYWKNLFKPDKTNKKLVWRCEALRVAGREVLSCKD